MLLGKWSLDTECASKAVIGKRLLFTNEVMVFALVFFVLLGGFQKLSTIYWCLAE